MFQNFLLQQSTFDPEIGWRNPKSVQQDKEAVLVG
jgi:hypothetical protein